jgi:hypothetical protein
MDARKVAGGAYGLAARSSPHEIMSAQLEFRRSRLIISSHVGGVLTTPRAVSLYSINSF